MIAINLLSKKDLYLATHDERGKLIKTKEAPYNMALSEGMTFSAENEFPQIEAYTGTTQLEYVSYGERKKHKGANVALHFFADDRQFSYATWERLERTSYNLREYEVLISPDYSLYADAPMTINKMNVYKSRFSGSYWQKCGYKVIPTASWANVDSFKYCLEGLPNDSVIAVCGTGHSHCHSAQTLWEYGIRQIEERLKPRLIIIYGAPTTIVGLQTETQFITDYITTKFRKHGNNIE